MNLFQGYCDCFLAFFGNESLVNAAVLEELVGSKLLLEKLLNGIVVPMAELPVPHVACAFCRCLSWRCGILDTVRPTGRNRHGCHMLTLHNVIIIGVKNHFSALRNEFAHGV